MWFVSVILTYNFIIFDSYPTADADEVAYTEPAFNLIEKGNDGHYSLRGVVRLDEEYIFCGKLTNLLNAAIFYFFGYGLIQARIISFLAAAFSIFVLFKLFSRIFGRNIAVLAVAMLLMSTDILPKKSGRPDMLVLAVLVSTTYFSLVFEKKLWIAGLLSTLGLWIHPTTSPAALIIPLLLNLRKGIKNILTIAGWQIAGILFYIFLYIVPNYELYMLQLNDFAFEYAVSGQMPPLWDVFRIINVLFTFFFIIGFGKNIPLFVILIVSVVYLIRQKQYKSLKLLSVVSAAFLSISLPSKHGGVMYVTYLLPFIFLAISEFICSVKRFRKALIFALTSYLALLMIGLVYQYKNNDIHEKLQLVSDNLGKGSRVLGDMTLLLFDNGRAEHFDKVFITFATHSRLGDKYRDAYGDTFEELVNKLSLTHVVLDGVMRERIASGSFPKHYRDSIYDYIDSRTERIYSSEIKGSKFEIFKVIP